MLNTIDYIVLSIITATIVCGVVYLIIGFMIDRQLRKDGFIPNECIKCARRYRCMYWCEGKYKEVRRYKK